MKLRNVFFIALMCAPLAVQAKTYDIAVQQVGAQSVAMDEICHDKIGSCKLSLQVTADNDTKELAVHILQQTNGVKFWFQLDGRYLYTADEHDFVFIPVSAKPVKQDIKLFIPRSKTVKLELNVTVRPHKK